MGRTKKLLNPNRAFKFKDAPNALYEADMLNKQEMEHLRKVMENKFNKYQLCSQDGVYWKCSGVKEEGSVLASFETSEERDQFIRYFNIILI